MDTAATGGPRTGPGRRAVVLGTVAGVGLLAACSGDEPAPAATTGTADGDLVAVDGVPVGGAVSVAGPDGPLVVSRPTDADVVAFSAVCTHQRCTVAPDGGQLVCPCHGSVYDAATGENVSGPAPRPLAPVEVRVVGGQVRIG